MKQFDESQRHHWAFYDKDADTHLVYRATPADARKFLSEYPGFKLLGVVDTDATLKPPVTVDDLKLGVEFYSVKPGGRAAERSIYVQPDGWGGEPVKVMRRMPCGGSEVTTSFASLATLVEAFQGENPIYVLERP